MATKTIAARQTSTDWITEAATTHKDLIVNSVQQAVHDIFGANTPPPFDPAGAIAFIAAAIDATTLNLVAADDSLVLGHDSREDANEKTSKAVQGLNAEIQAIRRSVESRFGKSVATKLGLSGTIRRSPQEALRHGRTVHQAFAAHPPLTVEIGGITYALADEPRALPALVTALSTRLDNRTNTRRSNQLSKATRDGAQVERPLPGRGLRSSGVAPLRRPRRPRCAREDPPPPRGEGHPRPAAQPAQAVAPQPASHASAPRSIRGAEALSYASREALPTAIGGRTSMIDTIAARSVSYAAEAIDRDGCGAKPS